MIDIIGNRYEKITVTRESNDRIRGARVFECLCDCGKIRKATYTEIRLGHVGLMYATNCSITLKRSTRTLVLNRVSDTQ